MRRNKSLFTAICHQLDWLELKDCIVELSRCEHNAKAANTGKWTKR
jgi:hypothetical protein